MLRALVCVFGLCCSVFPFRETLLLKTDIPHWNVHFLEKNPRFFIKIFQLKNNARSPGCSEKAETKISRKRVTINRQILGSVLWFLLRWNSSWNKKWEQISANIESCLTYQSNSHIYSFSRSKHILYIPQVTYVFILQSLTSEEWLWMYHEVGSAKVFL